MAEQEEDHSRITVEFCQLTGASTEQATRYLEAVHWSVESAAEAYFADQEEGTAAGASQEPQAAAAAQPDASYTGPRFLDGRPAPASTSSSSARGSSSKKPVRKTGVAGVATLSSLGGGGSGGHKHDEDDDDDDDEYDNDNDENERRGPRDLFAGGEKSGLAVQDPSQRGAMGNKKLLDEIVKQARTNARNPPSGGGPSAPSRPSPFGGSGQTLGGDGVESQTIGGPSSTTRGTTPGAAASDAASPAQRRTLHIWHDGFSIDEGPLRRFDDPANRADLAMIRSGRAPLHIMNVNVDQEVHVELQQHDENWRALPKVYRPFGGQGRRLGSPVPGDGSSSAAEPVALAAPAAAVTPPVATDTASTGVDQSRPTLSLRIQLPDGTRLPASFNTTQTVGDVYEFVTRSSTDLQGIQPWVLATTFPNKEHTDRGLVLGEINEFKKGGTAVVKWA